MEVSGASGRPNAGVIVAETAANGQWAAEGRLPFELRSRNDLARYFGVGGRTSPTPPGVFLGLGCGFESCRTGEREKVDATNESSPSKDINLRRSAVIPSV